MVKGVDKTAVIGPIQRSGQTGGRSGHFRR
jgi:molybdenum cofactor biosynthesis enzyme